MFCKKALEFFHKRTASFVILSIVRRLLDMRKSPAKGKQRHRDVAFGLRDQPLCSSRHLIQAAVFDGSGSPPPGEPAPSRGAIGGGALVTGAVLTGLADSRASSTAMGIGGRLIMRAAASISEPSWCNTLCASGSWVTASRKG